MLTVLPFESAAGLPGLLRVLKFWLHIPSLLALFELAPEPDNAVCPHAGQNDTIAHTILDNITVRL